MLQKKGRICWTIQNSFYMDLIGLLFSKVFHDYNSLKFVHDQGLKNIICKFDYNILHMIQTIQRFEFQFP
jgi:hypothetical protein